MVTIWEHGAAADFLLSISDEDKRKELINLGLDADMIASVDSDKIDEIIETDDIVKNIDREELRNMFTSMILPNTFNGLLILFDKNNQDKSLAYDALDIMENVYNDQESEVIKDNDNKIIIKQQLVDKPSEYELYTISDDGVDRTAFITNCLSDAIEVEKEQGQDTVEQLKNVKEYLDDVGYINTYLDNKAKIERYCAPVKQVVVESVDLEEAKSKNPDKLAEELAEIKAIFDQNGPEEFYSMTFEEFCNKFPEFSEVCVKKYLREVVDLTDEDFQDPNLEEYWANGELIDDQANDWECLIDGAGRLTTTRKDKGIQWEKIRKHYQTPKPLY